MDVRYIPFIRQLIFQIKPIIIQQCQSIQNINYFIQLDMCQRYAHTLIQNIFERQAI